MAKEQTTFDVIIIGAGPAGYVAAIRCAQLGLNTAIVDRWKGKKNNHKLGGTFLNSGCIPSVSLRESARHYHLAKNQLKEHGIKISDISLDLKATIRRKDRIIEKISGQIGQLFDDYGIHCIYGSGKLLEEKTVEVTPRSGSPKVKHIKADNIILAAGSRALHLDCAPIDREMVIDSYAAMNLETVPKKLGIIGAGVIGLDHGCVWSRFGSKVTLLDAQSSILPFADEQIVDQAKPHFSEMGLDIRLCARVTSVKKTANQVVVHYEDPDGQHQLKVDKLLVAAGRKPNTDDLFAQETDLLLDEGGFVHVDENCMTNLPGVYAVGDLITGPMLAHKGSEEGSYVAEQIAGKSETLNSGAIPNVIYTDPEIAWVGKTEQELRAAGEPIAIGTCSLESNTAAQARGLSEGMVKIIAHQETDQILGIHILGHNASELIAEAVVAMEFSASTEDLARTIHAHPSFAEAIHQAALDITSRALQVN